MLLKPIDLLLTKRNNRTSTLTNQRLLYNETKRGDILLQITQRVKILTASASSNLSFNLPSSDLAFFS